MATNERWKGRPGGWGGPVSSAAGKRPTWLRAMTLLFRPLKALTLEVRGVKVAVERLAEAAEYGVGRSWPRPAATLEEMEGVPIVDITYTTDQDQAELAEIELRLTRATGQAPTEDEIVQEFDRRRAN